MRRRLDIFLTKMRGKMQELSDEEFSTIVSAVMTNVAEKDKNLMEEYNRHWSELASHEYRFDR